MPSKGWLGATAWSHCQASSTAAHVPSLPHLAKVFMRGAAEKGLLNRHAMGADCAADIALIDHAAAALCNLPRA